MLSKPAKPSYSETEAAAAIGVTIEQLRSLIQNHIVARGEPLGNSPVLTFQRSDLLLLKFLAGQQAPVRD
jgi:hypothetical protein